LVFRGAGAFMRWILTVGTTVGAIGAVVPLVTLLVTVVTDNRVGGGYGVGGH